LGAKEAINELRIAKRSKSSIGNEQSLGRKEKGERRTGGGDVLRAYIFDKPWILCQD
jgi:hypothetical protein